jgi:curli biogenesis system outer membrane secretion channel CsgG
MTPAPDKKCGRLKAASKLYTKGLLALLMISTTALTACVAPAPGLNGYYSRPMGGAPAIANPTGYSNALVCLGNYARGHNLSSPRIAVGRIADYTGKVGSDGGRAITQGASLMAMTALAKSGARQVERFDTSIGELELKYANNRLITDSLDTNPNAPNDYRKIMAGGVSGSDFFIIGGITELNYNIRSNGVDAYIGGVNNDQVKTNTGGRQYVMNIALDMRLVDTKTLDVVDIISYQKQIIGREVKLGVFRFFSSNIYDISIGTSGEEPMQLAVRSLIERASLEFMANLYGAPGPEVCLSSQDDFLNDPTNTDVTGQFTPAYDTIDSNNGQTRAMPRRWLKAGTQAQQAQQTKPEQNQPEHAEPRLEACQDRCVVVPQLRRSRY